MCRSLDGTNAASSQKLRDALLANQRSASDLQAQVAALERMLDAEKQQGAAAAQAAARESSTVASLNTQVRVLS